MSGTSAASPWSSPSEGMLGAMRPEQGRRLPDPPHPGPVGASLGAVGEKRDPRRVAHQPGAVPCGGQRDARQLLRRGLGDDRAVGEGEDGLVGQHHVERGAHLLHPRRRADGPERGAEHLAGGEDGTGDRRLPPRPARPAPRRSWRDRRPRRARGRRPGSRRAAAAAGIRRCVPAADRPRGRGRRRPARSAPRSSPVRVAPPPSGPGDRPPRRARCGPAARRPAARRSARKVTGRTARASAAATAGCTSPPTSPPKRATSRTRLELRYVRSTAGTRKTVSSDGCSRRFISAIWNSYSKSLTARNPRTMMEAPTRLANSASRPSNDWMETRASPPTASRSMPRRSSTVKSGCLAPLVAIATITWSASARLRRTRSSWPFVGGSNEPGYSAILVMVRGRR